MKRLLPSLVAGFSGAVLLTVPYLQSLGCCLIIPFAGVFAVILDSKANYSDTSKYKLSHSALVGFSQVFPHFFFNYFLDLEGFINLTSLIFPIKVN